MGRGQGHTPQHLTTAQPTRLATSSAQADQQSKSTEKQTWAFSIKVIFHFLEKLPGDHL